MASGVETRHPSYEDKEYEWRQMRDTADGMSAVKRSAALYLPIPAAMLFDSSKQVGIPDANGIQYNTNSEDKSLKSRAPWDHPNKSYSAYLQRARFPDIVASTSLGLMGIATKKPAVVELGPSLSHLEEKATVCGLSLEELFKKCVQEILTTGRLSLLIDIVDNKPYFVVYIAESYINWKEKSDETTLAVYEEKQYGIVGDEFSQDESKKNLVLRINDDGNYESQEYMDGKPSKKVEVTLRGKRLKKIPNVTINATGVGNRIQTSPMIGISDIAISIYQKEADMANSEFVTCNPMLVFIGVDQEDAPAVVGSNVAVAFPNEDSDAKYVEPESNSLNHMKERIKDLFAEAATYGAALLGGTNKSEATETVRMRQEASGATLKTIVDSVENGITTGLDIMLEWMNKKGEEYTFEANREFSDLKLTSQEQLALMQAWMNKGISYDTYFNNLQKAGIVSEETTSDKERSKIESDGPTLLGGEYEEDEKEDEDQEVEEKQEVEKDE